MARSLRLTLVALLAVPSLAVAQVSLGLRAGYTFPAGDAYEQTGLGTFKQSDLVKSVIPLQLDASWRFNKSLSAGLYFAYGFGQAGTKLSDMCSTPGASCDSPTTMHYGAQVAYTLDSAGAAAPWFGLGVGMQSASFKVKGFMYGAIPGTPPIPLTADLDGTLRGWEGRVEGGADFRVSPSFLVGPLLTIGFGQYRVQDITLSGQGTVAGGGVDSPKMHELFTLGVRGRFDL